MLLPGFASIFWFAWLADFSWDLGEALQLPGVDGKVSPQLGGFKPTASAIDLDGSDRQAQALGGLGCGKVCHGLPTVSS